MVGFFDIQSNGSIINEFRSYTFADAKINRTRDENVNLHLYTVDSEIFARILFSRIVLKDILVM